MNNFIHLHVHSDFSTSDGAQSVSDIAKKAAKLEMPAVALTDHGRCGGLLKFKKACEENKIKPIYGIEAYYAPVSRLIKEKIDGWSKPAYHLTLLAKNYIGLQNIFTLSSLGWMEGQYYAKPRIDFELLKKYSEGIIVLSGCGSSIISQLLLEQDFAGAVEHKNILHKIFKDDFYIEVQNHNLEWQEPLNKMLFALSEQCDIPAVVTQDSHYQNKTDAAAHRAICKLGGLDYDGSESYFKSCSEIEQMFDQSKWDAIYRTQEVADKCNCNWEFGKTIWPAYGLKDGETAEEALRRKAHNGFAKLFGEGTQEYKDRLVLELDTIIKMGFPTYFLVVADYVQWAKENSIQVGAARGSGAASLVCYCLNITQIDPIKYSLPFSRFLNEQRVSLPDLDVDFDKDKRDQVIKYITNRYGQNMCSQIGTYAKFKPRGSIRNFARVLGYEYKIGDELSKLVPPDVAGKAMKFSDVLSYVPKLAHTRYQDIIQATKVAEGLNSQAGVHAAGMVISNSELMKQVPLFVGKGGEIASQFDMHDLETYGLVKFDLLGLKNLTVIGDTIELIHKHRGIKINIDTIDREDQEVFVNVFHKGELDGVFQFENSSGFRDLCVQVKPNSIEDLCDITSLYRPGPLSSGLVDQYVKGRQGEDIEYFIPELEPILKETYGVIVLQEQVMRICIDLAGYSEPEADNMRRIVGKKTPDKMKLERDKFVNGCVNNNIIYKKATKLFDIIEDFASYSFNKGHGVSYSVISSQTAWLKHYYPHEFYTAVLNNSLDNQDDMVRYIHVCKEQGISIVPPDINVSEGKFSLDNGTIIFGLAGIKGMGKKASEVLIAKRNELGKFDRLEQLIEHKINKGTVKALAQCGAIEGITDLTRAQILDNLDDLYKYYEKLSKWHERKRRIAEREAEIQQAVLAGEKPPRRLPKVKEEPQPPELGEQRELSKQDRLAMEREGLGFYITGHPLDDYKHLNISSDNDIHAFKTGAVSDNTRVSIPAIIASVTKIRTRSSNKEMATLKIEDRSGRIDGTIFPNIWSRLKDKVTENSVVNISGTIKLISSGDETMASTAKIIVNNVKVIDDLAQNIIPIVLVLQDGTSVTFTPVESQNYHQYQQARALVDNVRKMR